MKKEIQPFPEHLLSEVAQQCLCLNVRKAARSITQFYDDQLQPVGLRSTQFNLLVAVALARAIPLTKLAEILVMDRTTLTRNLKPLESQGLITVDTGADRRVRTIQLTVSGRQTLLEALPYWEKAQEQMVARLGREQSRILLNELNAITE